MIFKSSVNFMYPDIERGILYCVGNRIYMFDLNSGNQIGAFKGVSNPIQVLCDEARETLIVMSTVGEFAVFAYGHYGEPIWKFKLKQIDNTNLNSVLQDEKLYGMASSGEGKKFFVIDLSTREIKCNIVDRSPDEYSEKYRQKRFSALGVSMAIPEKHKTIKYVSCYYATDKFEFVGSWEQLLILPKEQNYES